MTNPEALLTNRLQEIQSVEEAQREALAARVKLILESIDGEVVVGARKKNGKANYRHGGRVWMREYGFLACHWSLFSSDRISSDAQRLPLGKPTDIVQRFIDDFPILFKAAEEALHRREHGAEVRSEFALEMVKSLVEGVRVETAEGRALLEELRAALPAAEIAELATAEAPSISDGTQTSPVTRQPFAGHSVADGQHLR